MKRVISILCSDIHLSLVSPVARSVEPDWLQAQGRVLNQLHELKKEHDCPIVVAGDVFDKWNVYPELINWTIDHLPVVYAVTGQHDLPLHSYDDLPKSAYWTLVKAKKIINLGPGESYSITKSPLVLHGFPWGSVITPFCIGNDDGYGDDDIHLAVVHDYFWKTGKGFPGAPADKCLGAYSIRFQGYDAVVFGDNHNGFLVGTDEQFILNSGCLIRRKQDERKYKAQVGLLYEDGTIGIHYLDTSEDKWLDAEEEVEELENAGLGEFLEELKQTDIESVDFQEEVKRFLLKNEVSSGAKKVILEVLGEK